MKMFVQCFEVLEGDFTNLLQLGFSGHLAIRRCDRIDQLSDCCCCVAVATSELIVQQRIFERAERVGAVLASAGKQSRANLRRRWIVLAAASPIEILCSGLIPLQSCWLHRCHLSSCCFDDKAKPLRERRCVSSAYTEMHYAFASFFLVPSELPQRPLTRAASKRCALSLTRHASSTFSVRREQKRAQAFCHQNQNAASAMALKGRARQHEAAYRRCNRNRRIQKCWPVAGDLVMSFPIK